MRPSGIEPVTFRFVAQHNVRYYLYFFFEEMRKIMENLEITDLWADFLTWMPLRNEVTVACHGLQNDTYLCPLVTPS